MQATLVRELDETWRALSQLLTAQAKAAATIESALADVQTTDYAAFRDQASRAILLDALDRWERLRPLKRAELAVEAYHRSLGELPRRLAESVGATGPEVLATVNALAPTGLSRRVMGWRRGTRTLAMQAIALQAIDTAEGWQLETEARYLTAIGRGIQELRRQWDRTRQALDARLASPDAPQLIPAADAGAVLASLDAEVRAALRDFAAASEVLPTNAAARMVGAAAWGRRVRPTRSTARQTRQFEHWHSQLGALQGELRFERAQDGVERRLLALGEQSCAALEAERRGLVDGIAAMTAWMDARLSDAANAEMPRIVPPIVPAERRMVELASAVRQIFDTLPDRVELIRQVQPVPRRGQHPTPVAPEHLAATAFERVAQSYFTALFTSTQVVHVGLIQQIERARQVIEFAAEGDGESDDAEVAREAMENARSLLAHEQELTATSLLPERTSMARLWADFFLENRLLLSRGRFGALAHLGRLGLRRGLRTAAAAALPALGRGLKVLVRASARLWRSFLIAIQWIPASENKHLDVIRRPYLPREFTQDPREKDLPAIYRRLFRFEAVDDLRFLVGREQEMQALTEARAFWDADRPVATLVVGERGSGKTSLINCAIEGPLAGLPVIRGEFTERLATATGVREFLAELCGTTPEGLEAMLLAEPRVVVLEETERTFLREMGGFAGIQELQRLISATSATTLWMLVINQHAFRFLDATVKLGGTFSHRLDAASASADAVRQAILIRHHLSGLRLRFLPPVSLRGRLARLRRRVRGAGDPEQLFFAALARESAGVFRTAFELWLGQIASVEAGTMVMKPIEAPAIDEVIEQLDTDDLFTLVAIKQHGSLTAEEHASVFQWHAAASRAQLDDLMSREIIESEPGRPGFRIRPGALRVTREALHRRNLG